MSETATINPVRLGVSNGAIPTASRVYSFNMNLTLNVTTMVDLRPFVYKNVIKEVQGIFIDNSLNTTALSVSVAGGQKLTVPQQSQGVFPLYLSDDYTLTVNGGGPVTFVLLNFPTPVGVWSVNPQALPESGGKLLVTDPSLDALIANGSFQSTPSYYANADAIVHGRAGNAYAGNLTAASTVTVIAGAPSAFVTGFDIALSPNATLATAGIMTVTLAFSTAGTIAARQVYVPAVAANGLPTEILKMSSLNLIGSIVADSLTVTLSAALTDGSVQYTIIGGTTAVT